MRYGWPGFESADVTGHKMSEACSYGIDLHTGGGHVITGRHYG